MKAGSRFARGEWRAAAAVLFSIFLASCTSTGEPVLELATPSYDDAGASQAITDPSQVGALTAEGDISLPDQVAYLPVTKPSSENSAIAATGTMAAPDQPADAAPEQPVAAAPAVATAAEPAAAEPAAAAAPVQAAADGPVLENGGPILTAGVMPDAPIEPKKKSFLSSFFGASPAAAAPGPVRQNKPKPLITLASATPEDKPIVMASLDGGGDALPGVRQTALFEIKRKSGLDDDSDVDLHEDEEGAPLLLASAAGLARLAPNGLLKQRESVDVACLKPSLVRVLKTVERHYGRKIVVTSGYRSRIYNRRVRGAKNSMHMYCAAADVQIAGVSKWELAKFVRSMPGRGGVGTYCHTESVHIDVGPERDWNWRCRRRK